MTALHDLPAHDLLAAYRQRTLSPVEVTQAVLAHIERWEPHIRATYLLRPEMALAQARESEARWLRGEPKGDPFPMLGDGVVRSRCTARRPHARCGRRHRGQDHHA